LSESFLAIILFCMDQLSKFTVGNAGGRKGTLGCDHPGCAGAATHRAPKNPGVPDDHYWFCLDHVREYNSKWNYYAGMTDRQVEQEIRNDTVWRRPTWPLGGKPANDRYHARMNFRDEFGVFEGAAGARRQQKQSDDREPAAHIRRALRIMAIEPPVTLTELKSRYKELVKRLHPDANGGDRVAEDKLKDINQAYATIKKFLAA
jgi:hypothetical protein